MTGNPTFRPRQKPTNPVAQENAERAERPRLDPAQIQRAEKRPSAAACVNSASIPASIPRAAASLPPWAGLHAHVPNKATRERVEILMFAGVPVPDIAVALGLSEADLRALYAAQLAGGEHRKRAEIVEALFRAASERGSVSALREMLKQSGTTGHAAGRPKGKKEAIQDAARTATEGTEWANLLPN